jgi:ParB-like chromosome segregation protein Spo0J
MQTEIKTCKVANYVPIKKLKFHPKNEELRSISYERLQDLKDSLIKKGFYEPILVWKKKGYVLAGNQRLRAAQELIAEGYEFVTPDGKVNELPVVIEDVDESMAMQILHQANNHHGDWVQQKLAEAIKEAEGLGISAVDLGYTDAEVKNIMKEAERMVKLAEDDLSDRNREINADDFGEELDHKCPKCGFEYNE